MACSRPHPSTINKTSTENFDAWNPMVDDFKNKTFNAFVDGPGANLDDNLQPGAVAAKSNQNIEFKYRLCLKYVPKDMTKNAIRNLCLNYGKVIMVFESVKTPVKFVSFATLSDMTQALNGLENNPYGIKVEIAKEFVPNSQRNINNEKDFNYPSGRKFNNDSSSSQIDMERRSIKGPFANPPRPTIIQLMPAVTENDYKNSKLITVDPKRNFLIENDMHYDDRINKNDNDNNNDANYKGRKIYTGRSYFVESNETMEKIKRLSDSSIGQFEAHRNTYIKPEKCGLENIKLKNCIYCKKMALKMCGRCHSYYCSTQCQKADWQQHRKTCLPVNLPKLEDNDNDDDDEEFADNFHEINFRKVKEMIPENCNNDFQTSSPTSTKDSPLPITNLPKSGSRISITTVTKSNMVYIRSLESKNDLEFVKILGFVDSYAINSKTLNKMPKKGDIVIANFEDNGYFRAMILNPIDRDKIVIIYLDFGNIDEKKLSELKEASPEIAKLKCQTICVRLKNVPDFEPTAKVKNYLTSFVDSIEADLQIIYDDNDKQSELNDNDTDRIEVEIWNKATSECLNKRILELKEIEEPKDSDMPVFKKDIKQKLLPSGKNVEVYIFDNSVIQLGYISCILEKDIIPLQNLNTQMKEYAGKIDGCYTPRQSELCVVQYEDDEWYRAECLEVVGDENPALLFIDYGNMSPVHINKIRKYPKEFKYFPCCTSTCMISDLPEEIDDKVAARLQELLPTNSKLIIDEISSENVDDETNLIYLPNIIKILKEENLI